MSNKEAFDELDRRLMRAATDLGEHFDTVQIVATLVHDDKSTVRFNKGKGNMYARMGSTREWLVAQEGEFRSASEDGD